MSWVIIFLYILAVIFIFIFIFLFIECFFNLNDDKEDGWISIIFYGILFIVTLCAAISTDQSPQAIDVYRGKTELKIIYIIQGSDTLQRDSVVVWRK